MPRDISGTRPPESKRARERERESRDGDLEIKDEPMILPWRAGMEDGHASKYVFLA